MKNKINKEPIKTIMLKKASSVEKVDINQLLGNIAIAIERWAQACIDRDETPVCISGFVSVNDKTNEVCTGNNILIGEKEDMMPILKSINQLLTS